MEADAEGITPPRHAFGRLTELRAIHDWRPAVRMTPWTPATEGHMIVIEPDGTAQAWPAYDQPDLFLRLGSLLQEPITAIWDRYPYKASHYAKYLGTSTRTAPRSVPVSGARSAPRPTSGPRLA